MLSPVLDQVFTDAVLEAGIGSGGALSKEAFIKSALSIDLASVVPMFKPTHIVGSGRIEMSGTLQQDFGGCTAGEVVDVCVELDEEDEEGLGFVVSFRRHKRQDSAMDFIPARLLLGRKVAPLLKTTK
jgi:hypothetical protein